MKNLVSILSFFVLIFSSIMPVGVGEAYYLNGDTTTNYPNGTDIKFYDVAGNERAIMGYNLGATEDNENGLFFQWGNNHAFPRDTGLSSCQLDEEGNGNCPLEGSATETGTDYYNLEHYDSENNNWIEGDQGPCQSGYHVPTGKEWNNLLVQRCEDSESCDTRDLLEGDLTNPNYWFLPLLNGPVIKSRSVDMNDVLNIFMQKYNLQLAGCRDSGIINGVNGWSVYWSSSLFDRDYYVWDFLMNDMGLGLGNNHINDLNFGGSVRCFKNSTAEPPLALALNFYAGGCLPTGDELFRSTASFVGYCEDNFIDRIFVPANQTLSESKIMKVNGEYNWYTENVEDEQYKVDFDTIIFTESTNLYGFSKCEDNEQYVDGQCVEIKWGAKINENGEYECLAENAEYSEVEGQCVYEIEDILGNTTTIMSSNLGATETNPMGDFYQWGNDYRYPRYPSNAFNNGDCNLDEDGKGYCPLDGYEYYRDEDETRSEHTDYYINEHYSSYDGYDWPEGAQGPCPSGYHVPTVNEWANILVKWCEDDEVCDSRDLQYGNNGGNINHWYLGYPLRNGTQSGDPDLEVVVNRFASKYNLSFAGLRNNNTIFYAGSWGGYRSSLSNGNHDGVNFGIEPANGIGMRSSSRRGGLSVRCINDSYSAPSIIALDLYRGCEESGESGPVLSSSSLCGEERLGRKFIGADDGVINTDKLTEIAIQYGNLPTPDEGKQWVWYLVNEQDETKKITPSTRLSANGTGYVFEEDIPTYTVTFNSNGGSTVNSIDIEEGNPIQTLPISKKDGYTLEGWYLDEGLTERYNNQLINKAITLYARWTENKGNGYSGGGSSSSSSKPKVKPADKQHNVADEEGKKAEPEIKKEEGKNIKIITNTSVDTSRETFNAHQWAYAKGLTKYRTSSEARMDDFLNRSEMAKISSIFATEFLDKTPDIDKKEFCSQYSDMWKVEDDMKFFIAESCELGYMGYESNGVDTLERFRPYTPLTVAETATILSRIVWGNENAMNGKDRYKGHLYAAYNYGLIDDIKDPITRNITRREAYTMLYRLINMLD